MILYYKGILVLSLIKLSVTLNCNQRNVTDIETQLKLTLLCDYEPYLVPTNSTMVNLIVNLQNLYIITDIIFGELSLIIKYNETGLVFDPKDYNGITEISTEIENIWLPKMIFYEIKKNKDKGRPQCKIQFNGTVTCKYIYSLEITSPPNYNNWPLETRNTSFSILSVSNYKDRIKFDLDISVDDNMKQLHCKLAAYEVFLPDINSSLFYPIFGLTILTTTYTYREYYMVVYPLYTIMVIIFIAFAMEFDSFTRIGIIAVTILLETNLLRLIIEAFYERPILLPNIVIQYRLIFGTSCFLISETLILRCLTRKIIRPPYWFSHLENLYKLKIFNFHVDLDIPSHIKYNLPADNLKWRLFYSILDRIFFIVWMIYNAYVMSF